MLATRRIMEGSELDEGTFFAAISAAGVRALLIGRRRRAVARGVAAEPRALAVPPTLPPEVARLIETELPVEEFLARVRAPITAEELADVVALVSWFTRRDPTVAERLGCVRRAPARWRKRKA
jgi:hypothetical protein